jgi:proteasome ATPase
MDEREMRMRFQELKEALEAARVKLVEQDKILRKVTDAPRVFATVMKVTEPPSKMFTEEQLQKALSKKGARVRIIPGTEYEYQSEGNAGTVDDVSGRKSGWVGVKWDHGHSAGYRFGSDETGGDCDLMLDEPPGTVVVITTEGAIFGVHVPEKKTVIPGDMVTLSGETMQITDVSPMQFGGDIGSFRQIIDNDFSEVDYEGGTRVVFHGRDAEGLEKGDRVVLDASGNLIVRNLGKEDEKYRFEAESGVSWGDIGGLEEAKRTMIEAIELPHLNKDIFAYYHKKPTKGVLLYGPPGCGKTMLGKAAATSLAKIYGGKSGAGFLYVKGPEILNKYVGESEATVRSLFERARQHKKDSGFPAVLFIDEAESILSKRGSGISSDIDKTIVPMFLAEMDGLGDSGALVILATNRPDILDPAVVRDGRVDRKVRVTRPTEKSAEEIFRLNFKGVPSKVPCEELSAYGSAELFNPKRVLYDIETKKQGVIPFTLCNVLSGGMIANIVDQATTMAMRRDLADKKKGGVEKRDVLDSVALVEVQNRNLDHTDVLAEFVEDFRKDVVNIQKRRAV